MTSDIRPVGRVVSIFRNRHEAEVACREELHLDTESEIVVRKDLAPALEGLGGFSHVWVIYGHMKAGKVDIRTRPDPGDPRGLPPVGVFASKSCRRPGQVMMRLVELLEVRGNRLRVRGLDVATNSPVLDVQPYVPYHDVPEKPRVADWYSRWYR